MCLFYHDLKAQCEVTNNQFQAGEVLTYDLYFKYGVIYTKAGKTVLRVRNETYNGESAYKMTLTANSSGVVKAFFSISDTLSTYMTRKLVPLAYTKDAHEGGNHTTERAKYTYSPGRVELRNINIRNGNLRYDTTLVSNTCMHDMLGIVYYARTLDYSSMKKGDKISVPFWSGNKKINMDIIYSGIESMTANDDREYNCIKLILNMNDKAFEDKKETMQVFMTDDSNRIPVRIDTKLKIGSTRVILKSFKGQKH